MTRAWQESVTRLMLTRCWNAWRHGIASSAAWRRILAWGTGIHAERQRVIEGVVAGALAGYCVLVVCMSSMLSAAEVGGRSLVLVLVLGLMLTAGRRTRGSHDRGARR